MTHDLSETESVLLRFFQQYPRKLFEHSELEYGLSVRGWFIDQGLEVPKNIGRTARQLVQKGHLIREAKGKYCFVPEIDPVSQAVKQARIQLHAELKSIVSALDRATAQSEDSSVASEHERSVIRELQLKVLAILREEFPTVLE
jgi:hypothetical protein